MNPELKALYAEAADFFTYVKLYAPEFPARDELSCEKAISRLTGYLATIHERDEHPAAKPWLRACREEINKAAESFRRERHSEARRSIGSAREYLSNAERRDSTKPAFIIGEPGFSE